MIRCRHIGPSVTVGSQISVDQQNTCRKNLLFPHVIASEAYDGNEHKRQVEYPVRPQPFYKSFVLRGKSHEGGYGGVQGQEKHGEYERSRDGYKNDIRLGPISNEI